MGSGLSNWLFYRLGAPVYEKVLGTWTLGGWWRWQRAVLEGLPCDDPILELGCGTGRLLAQRLEAGPAVGLDMSMPMLSQVRRRFVDRPVPVLVSDAGRLPFADDTFGAVISTGVLTTMPCVRDALAEACRVVRPGGRLASVWMRRCRSRRPCAGPPPGRRACPRRPGPRARPGSWWPGRPDRWPEGRPGRRARWWQAVPAGPRPPVWPSWSPGSAS